MAKGRTLSLLSTAQRAAFRKARQDGGHWTTVAVVTFGARLLAKLAVREPEVVHTQKLGRGEQLVISHTTDTHGGLAKREAQQEKQAKRAKRDKKRAKRAARRSGDS